jgi:cell division protein FtsW (lipid II flippase)
LLPNGSQDQFRNSCGIGYVSCMLYILSPRHVMGSAVNMAVRWLELGQRHEYVKCESSREVA